MDFWSPKVILRAFITFAIVWTLGVLVQGFASANGWAYAKADFALSGTFGDSFGGLSAFMATAAAIGAWQAVKYQQDELRSSRKREDSLDELAAKRDFETTFFHLQRTLDRLVEQIDIGLLSWKKTGRDAFSYFVDRVYKERRSADRDYGDAYAIVYLANQNDLSHYFRTLFNVIVFVDQERQEDAYFYVKVIRATLSEPELVMLALNGLYHDEGKTRFKPLIEKYALLNNISGGAKADFDLENGYDARAFGSRGLEIMRTSAGEL